VSKCFEARVRLQTYVHVVEGGFIICHFEKLYAVEIDTRNARISK
jgi:hypothetical protein